MHLMCLYGGVCVCVCTGWETETYVCVCLVLCGIHAVKHIAMPCIISAGTLPNALTPSFLQRALINCQLTGGPKPKGFQEKADIGEEGLISMQGAKRTRRLGEDVGIENLTQADNENTEC